LLYPAQAFLSYWFFVTSLISVIRVSHEYRKDAILGKTEYIDKDIYLFILMGSWFKVSLWIQKRFGRTGIAA
jgi:hypothetical protein